MGLRSGSSDGPRTEYELFSLICATLGAARPQARVMKALSDPAIVNAMIELAQAERVLPAFADRIVDHYPDVVAKSVRAVLAVEREANRRRNASISQVVLELGAAGAPLEIDFVALKGAAWCLENGDRFAPWRLMGDLDVLVDPRRFGAARQLLAQHGYAPLPRAAIPAAILRYAHLWHFHLATVLHPEKNLALDVHRHLGWYPRLLPTEVVLANARRIAPGILLPEPWQRAFHAMIHWQVQDFGLASATVPLRHVLEVARFLARHDVDWPALSAHARSVGAATVCEAAAAIAAELLSAPVPPPLANAHARRQVDRVVVKRSSPLRTRLTAALMPAQWAWRCDMIPYIFAIRGTKPITAKVIDWTLWIVRIPYVALFALGIAVQSIVLWLRAGRRA